MSPANAAPLLALLLATAAAVRDEGGRVDFAADVLPVLEEKCARCHGAPREDERGRLRLPKGGLRLDGRAWIERGANGDPVLVAGDAAASALYALCVLDEDDPDRMPKSGDGLTSAEADLLRRWIDGGASFGTWVGEPLDPALLTADEPESPESPESTFVLPPGGAEWVERAKGVSSADERDVERLRHHGARVEGVVPGSPLLRVSFPSSPGRVGDEVREWLAPVAANVAWLDLSRTSAGDRAILDGPRFPRLARLDLRGTAVTDEAVKGLDRFERLEELSLFDTAVTEESLEALAGLESLHVVRLGETRWTEEGRRRLRALRPDLRVVGDPRFDADD